MILWGPPGVGKTTLAKIIAETTQASFIEFSAVMSGIKEIKQVMATAAQAAQMHSRTILFVDEIHRFNKAQQDAFLPYVERGVIRLIGATTENPSFEIISALLSRCRVYVLQPLSEERIAELLRRALNDKERGLGALELTADDDALTLIASYSSGDCRSAYNTLEVAAQLAQAGAATKHIDRPLAIEAVQQRVLMYDKSGEEHYNLISALHKSVRNSDPDASLYWLARMFAAGEDPLYLARRVVRMAVEDIGLADPRALEQAIAAQQAAHFLGIPEGDLALGQAAIYLAVAPKSDASYKALGAAVETVEKSPAEPVPMQLRNAPTRAMKQWGYGAGYQHAHQFEDAVNTMECLPESLKGTRFYQPTDRGMEQRIAQRLAELRAKKESGDRSQESE
jgi:putative ATPase